MRDMWSGFLLDSSGDWEKSYIKEEAFLCKWNQHVASTQSNMEKCTSRCLIAIMFVSYYTHLGRSRAFRALLLDRCTLPQPAYKEWSLTPTDPLHEKHGKSYITDVQMWAVAVSYHDTSLFQLKRASLLALRPQARFSRCLFLSLMANGVWCRWGSTCWSHENRQERQ